MNKSRSRGRLVDFPRLLGGHAALDYVNTIERRLGEHPHDYLTDPTSLANWGFHAGVISNDELNLVRTSMRRNDFDGTAVMKVAIEVREALYRILARSAAMQRQSDVDLVTSAIREALTRSTLMFEGNGFRWDTAEVSDWLITDRIALDAMNLLTSNQLTNVRQCPGCDDCGWLFLDSSKNGTRRWCSMEGCGSRAKMRRYHHRLQGVDDSGRQGGRQYIHAKAER